MRRVLVFAGVAAALLWPALGSAAGDARAIPHRHWSFDGLFGTFDRSALQRGFQVYSQVCSACHSLALMRYRNLSEIGFDKDKVKQVAAAVEVTDGPNDQGEMFQRPGRPSDRFKSPFANEPAARVANNGAYPPDLSLLTKAHASGPNHPYAVLTSYAEPPSRPEEHPCRKIEEEKQPNGSVKQVIKVPEVRQGQFYNPGMPGCLIAMPPPLQEDSIQYEDGTKATIEQMAADVSTFLTWAAEPELETRKRLGVKVILVLILLTGLFYAIKISVWKDVKH